MVIDWIEEIEWYIGTSIGEEWTSEVDGGMESGNGKGIKKRYWVKHII